VLTDIAATHDQQSLIRLMVYTTSSKLMRYIAYGSATPGELKKKRDRGPI